MNVEEPKYNGDQTPPATLAPDRPFPVHPGAAEEEEQDGATELVQFAGILWQRRWWVIGTTLFFVVVAAMQLRNAKEIYHARAQIRYEPTATRVVEFGEIGRAVSAQDEFNTQLELIRGSEVTQMVIDALGSDGTQETVEQTEAELLRQESEEAPTPIQTLKRLYRDARFEFRNLIVPYEPVKLRPEEIAEQNRINATRARIRVSQVPETKLINIVARHPDTREAARLANAFAEQYRNSIVHNRDKAYSYAREFYNEQIYEAEQKLQEAEEALLKAGGDSELQLLEQEQSLTIGRISQLQQRIFGLSDQIALGKSTNFDEAPAEVRELLLEGDPEVNALRSSIENLQIERANLLAENFPEHPDVLQVERRITSLQDLITTKVMNFGASYDARITLWENEREALIRERLDAQAKLENLSQSMIDYKFKERAVQEKNRLYEMLLTGYSQINVTASVQSDQVTIEEYAVPQRLPVEPNVGRSLIVHGMLGGFLGCLLALGLNLIDRSMRDPRQVQTQTGLSNLGIIPYLGGFFKNPIPGKARSRVRLITEFDPYSNEAEAFRLIRTSLQYSTAGKSPQIIMITSSMPGEGKTTACANLAISFAGLGEKTLVIDSDLKLPSMHRVFGVERRPGLSDLLTGQKTLDEVISSAGVESLPNLDILPAGPDAPNPVELLESVKMTDTLAELRKRYRHIIMDAPPLYGMSDSYVLATRTDGVCLMASLGKTRTDIFRRTVQSLNAMKARTLGIVFNNQIRNYRGSGQYGYYKTPGAYGYMRRGRGKYSRRSASTKA